MPTETSCSNAACKVASTSTCSEGHTPLQSCPYYGRSAAPEEPIVADDVLDLPDRSEGIDQVELPAGEALSVSEVDDFLRWRPVTLIAIVGDRDSGKSTLLASLYGRFLQGPFASHLFAGSRTLVALEQKSHFSRIESGLTQPDTARTSISEGLRFIHLALAPQASTETRVDLMLSDRAGETYRNARSNSALIPDLIEVKKANRVILILDGGRIADPPQRAGAMQAVRQSFRALSDGGVLNASAIVQVVTTKIDLLLDHADKALIDTQLTNFRNQLTSDFGGRVAEITFWDVAARDPRASLPPAFGLENLLLDWVTPRPAPRTPARLPTVVSELDCLLTRPPLEVLP